MERLISTSDVDKNEILVVESLKIDTPSASADENRYAPRKSMRFDAPCPHPDCRRFINKTRDAGRVGRSASHLKIKKATPSHDVRVLERQCSQHAAGGARSRLVVDTAKPSNPLSLNKKNDPITIGAPWQ